MPPKAALPRSNRPDLGLGTSLPKRHRKILRGNIHGITKPAIRRLARRGGVKRISADIYDETRKVVRSRLESIIRQLVAVANHRLRGSNVVRVADVIFVLRRLGTPVYGFDNTNQMNPGSGVYG